MSTLKKLSAVLLTACVITGCASNSTDVSTTQLAAETQTVEATQGTTAAEETSVTKLEADVVVVGAGVSGLNAAIEAARNGVNVIVLEKLGLSGGSGSLSSGALITCNSNGLIDGDDSVETVMNVFENTAALGADSGYPDYDAVEFILNETGNTVNGLIEQGLPTPSTLAHGLSYAIMQNKGAGYMASLTSILEGYGVSVITDTPAKELILDGDSVVGVKAENQKDGEIEVYATTVILACGGYGANSEKLKELTGIDSYIYEGRVCVGDVGDGIDMALQAGAVLYDNQWPMVSTTMPAHEYNRAADASNILSLASSLAVTNEGVRFVNENPSSYSSFGNVMIENGLDACYALMNATDETRETLEAGIESGAVVKGSVEEIAAALGMDAETLKATVESYNGLCDAGEDTEFGKDSDNLVKLDTEELYAVTYEVTIIGTLGGVVTNDAGEVLRADGTSIDGLLAVGEMSNRKFYNYHYVGGASLGLYTTMGRLAGAYAAERVTQ